MKRSPAAALWLSVIPGAGHVYVGQLSKGLMLILLVISTIQLVSSGAGAFGIFIPFLWLYGMLDAYQGAIAYNRIVESGGQPPRNTSFAFSKWWGFLLIGLGAVFTLDNLDILDLEDLTRFWPLGLVALGVFILKRQPASAGPEPPSPSPPESSREEASPHPSETSEGAEHA